MANSKILDQIHKSNKNIQERKNDFKQIKSQARRIISEAKNKVKLAKRKLVLEVAIRNRLKKRLKVLRKSLKK